RQANVALDHSDVRGVDVTWKHLSREKQWEKLTAWVDDNKFFLGGDMTEKKMSWVRWNQCLASKDLGGLGEGH
nr:RNA-directed DNA polymerase, eukaryota, reverse transcriptase zinc-binding domain protein [Tanacetum cinerariifolium]